ncbi:MAG TPA: hypothetical protein VK581_07405 [Chthoniobacterales bacterium]|nr:hypothetical protein [Chthoniobacterales bacterium]
MKTFLYLLSVASLVVSALTTQAGTVEYPAGNALIKVELPDGWTSSSDKDGNLDVKANDKSEFDFSIIPASVGTEKDVKAFLPQLAQTMGKDLKELEVGQLREFTSKTGIKMMVQPAKGKMGDQEMMITLAAFAPAKEKYFIIMSMAEKSVDEAHDKAMGQIVNSIKLIE